MVTLDEVHLSYVIRDGTDGTDGRDGQGTYPSQVLLGVVAEGLEVQHEAWC